MKRTVEKEVSFCDDCGKDCGVYVSATCIGCGKEYCYECSKHSGIQYEHGVYVCGSGDGFYCFDCDRRLMAAKDRRLLAYHKIQQLRQEAKAWSRDFEARREAAELELRDLFAAARDRK